MEEMVIILLIFGAMICAAIGFVAFTIKVFGFDRDGKDDDGTF